SDRRGVAIVVGGALRSPRRAGKLDGGGEETMRRSAASEKGAGRPSRKKHRALPARARFRRGAARIGLGGSGLERGAILSERAGAASGVAGTAEGRADIHERLREIARSLAWRQRSRRCRELSLCAGDRFFE